jgi:Glycosyltransferase 61
MRSFTATPALGDRLREIPAAEFAIKAANWSGWSSLAHARPAPEVQTLWSRAVEADGLYGTEFVRRSVGPSYVEPRHGYVVHDSGVLLEESIRPALHLPKPLWRSGTPSVLSFLRAKRNGGVTVTHEPRVISLRHFWEWNYYHFFLDVMGKLSLFDRVGLDPEIPIVLGRYATQVPFVRQVLARGDLANRNWILQEDNHVCASEVYYCRSFEGYRTKIDHLLDLMAVPVGQHDDATDRVFLTRPRGARTVLNMDEIEPVLKEYEFETVDTSAMTVDDQIETFMRTRHLLAVHGAGMTNLIFRRGAPMSVLEIHPEVHVSRDFMNICHEYSYEHARLACRPGGSSDWRHASLYIDPRELRAHIERMLSG